MKNSRTELIAVILLTFALFSVSDVLSSQPNQNTPDKFLILVETTNEGIKLTGIEGCAFKELSFSYSSHNNQAIDGCGMTNIGMKPGCDFTTFLFRINKTKDGLTFEGLKGTAWKNLNFSCPNGRCHQFIDQNGMTDLK